MWGVSSGKGKSPKILKTLQEGLVSEAFVSISFLSFSKLPDAIKFLVRIKFQEASALTLSPKNKTKTYHKRLFTALGNFGDPMKLCVGLSSGHSLMPHDAGWIYSFTFMTRFTGTFTWQALLFSWLISLWIFQHATLACCIITSQDCRCLEQPRYSQRLQTQALF